jgi:TPR repeat protein
MDGIGIQKNVRKALEWFLKSEKCEYNPITQNDSDGKKEFKRDLKLAIITNDGIAQNYLGYCYMNGKGINKNETKAFDWYLKSATVGCIYGQSSGNAVAQNNLGDCYQFGVGTDKNEIKAFEWYLKSAIAGCNNGKANLGFCYQYGIGTDKNEIKAFEWYSKAAENGIAIAQNNLGYCYHFGKGIDKDETKAFKWFLKSAVSGYTIGQCNLGYCYQYGIGADKNEKKAFEWYSKAVAESRNTIAQNNLLEFRYAKDGIAVAQNNLAYCYKNGTGIEKNETKAFELFLKSAEGGNVETQNYIGEWN